jgi:SAM-dependent methyltransferase
MSLVETIHGAYVHTRRCRVLGRHFADLVPHGAAVLDVGSGDGLLDHVLLEMRPDLSIRGVDVLVRPATHIPVEPFDGRTLPYDEDSFDAVLFVDVLHHTHDPMVLLREAARVARRAVLIKDHTLQGFLAGPQLRFMDRVSNARHGVVLPNNYWTSGQWHEAFAALGLTVEVWRKKLGLYPWPATWVFDRSLHFVCRLGVNGERPA